MDSIVTWFADGAQLPQKFREYVLVGNVVRLRGSRFSAALADIVRALQHGLRFIAPLLCLQILVVLDLPLASFLLSLCSELRLFSLLLLLAGISFTTTDFGV